MQSIFYDPSEEYNLYRTKEGFYYLFKELQKVECGEIKTIMDSASKSMPPIIYLSMLVAIITYLSS